MKQKLGLILNIIMVVIDVTLGITRLYRGLSGAGGSYAAPVGVVWLILAAIWAVRPVREFHEKSKETTDETDHV